MSTPNQHTDPTAAATSVAHSSMEPRARTSAAAENAPTSDYASTVPSDVTTSHFDEVSNQFEQAIGRPSREAVHSFFYPQRTADNDNTSNPRQSSVQQQPQPQSLAEATGERRSALFDQHFDKQADDDQQFVHRFWTTYDDILMLSLFTQLGIVFRLAASTWFANFDNVFNTESPLFVVLPLNCLSCFLMGMLCSGERLMEIVHTRFSPPRLQQMVLADDGVRNERNHTRGLLYGHDSDNDDEEKEEDGNENDGLHVASGHSASNNSADASPVSSQFASPLRRRGRKKKQKYFHSWQPPVHLNEDLRDVQLLALERRIRASKCLLLFPVRKEDVDVMEHYFSDGYHRDRPRDRVLHAPEQQQQFSGIFAQQTNNGSSDRRRGGSDRISFDLELEECTGPSIDTTRSATQQASASSTANRPEMDVSPNEDGRMSAVNLSGTNSAQNVPPLRLESDNTEESNEPEGNQDDQIRVDQIITDVTANVTENISRLRRVNIADGWDTGTTPGAMSDDIMLGLRDGFCGALSSFSSWNSAMVDFVKRGAVGKAVVGYMLGLQLPIIAYRFGQHVAVYAFVWRCRFETKRDERRGYGIRVSANDHSENAPEAEEENGTVPVRHSEKEMPSLRAIITAVFIMALVTQCTSLSFFASPKNQELALSLLFSPLGVLARWRLSKLNTWRPTFPLGTFTSNMLACALSGGLGHLLAGQPGPLESIVLVSFINGFGGTMSSLASFVVEILAGVDPILMRFDGMIYASLSIMWAMVIGILFSTSVDWADATTTA